MADSAVNTTVESVRDAAAAAAAGGASSPSKVATATKALELIQALKALDRREYSWAILQHVRPIVEPLGATEQKAIDEANNEEFIEALEAAKEPLQTFEQLLQMLPLVKPSSRSIAGVFTKAAYDAATALQKSGSISDKVLTLGKNLILHLRQHGAFHSANSQIAQLEKIFEKAPSSSETGNKALISPGGVKGGKKKRVPLTPQRAAPLPPTTTNDENRRFSGEGFQKVKSWLKNLRLHKYCHIFEALGYDQMVNLTEAELEALGITAKGARSKMLKSIETLKKKNDSAISTLSQLDQEALVPSRLVDVLKELLEILEVPSPSKDERAATQIMNLLSKAFTTYVAVQAQGSSQSLEVVQNLVAVLDAAMKHEIFSIEQKNVLFSTKSACNQLVQTLSAPSAEDRWSIHDPTQLRGETSILGGAARRQPGPQVPHVPYDATGQMMRARQQRSYSLREGQQQNVIPTERSRGFSIGSEVQPIGTMSYQHAPHHQSDPSIMRHGHSAWSNPGPAILQQQQQGDLTHKAPGHERKMSGRSAPPGFYSGYAPSYSIHGSSQALDDGEILALSMTEHALQDSSKPDQYTPH